MEVGDEWICRLRPYRPSERVRIVGIEKRKQTTRVDIEFLDGGKAGARENVHGARLPRPWSDGVEYDALMANWQRLDRDSPDESEDWVVAEVFSLLNPEDVASYDCPSVRHGTSIYRLETLEQVLRRPMADVLEQVEWFTHDGVTELSARGACSSPSTRAQPVLPWCSTR